MKDNSVVIGRGYVGKSTMKSFGIEKYLTRSDGNITNHQIAECKFIFICLPTPTIDGKVFTADIESTIKLYQGMNPDSIIIIRSTVPPGFAKSIGDNIVSNPEFLSEDTWEEDAVKPKMIVLGGEGKALEAVKGLYMGRFKYCQPLVTDNTTAEMIKYAFNTFFATKVVFNNEIFDACQKFGANYATIKRALEAHPWGQKGHGIIFYKGKRGLHGSCLPKDTEAFANLTGSKLLKVISEAYYE
jgi:UDPglucose 6-dehydrogenase